MNPAFRAYRDGKFIYSTDMTLAEFFKLVGPGPVDLRTHITARNAKWIYENDIVRTKNMFDIVEEYILFFDHSAMLMSNGVIDYFDDEASYTIIGNAHEDPDKYEEIKKETLPF